MKKLIETINNICKIEDLRNRILITFLFVLIYRFGSFIVLPGIDPSALTKLQEQTDSGLMALLNMFSGGAFSNASVFALGIMPYISASIVVQLLGIAVPSFQKMQKDGENGRRKLQQYTRILTVFILLLQGPSYLLNLSRQLAAGGSSLPEGIMFSVTSTIILCAGSMFVMWLGERITDKGIGNGISIIILVGIIARFPSAIVQEFSACLIEEGGLVKLLIEIICLLLVTGAAILLVQGIRKVPIQQAKRLVSGEQYDGGARKYLPLKVNAANVMPIIFAQAIMFIPLAIAPWVAGEDGSSSLLGAIMDPYGVPYNIISAFLIILFTYFYTAIMINPTQMAEDLKRSNSFIPGVKPGKETAEFIDVIMSRITLPGSVFLALLAILPALVFSGFNVTAQFAQFFGGTSLLIIVGVVLDTLQQVESHLLMRHYDGLMKSGRIRGRSGVSAY